MFVSRVARHVLASGLCVLAGASHAQCGVSFSCGGVPSLGDVLQVPSVCDVGVCFSTEAARQAYERENNCRFPPQAVCGGVPMNPDSQCCGRDARTGADRVQARQRTALDTDFNWDRYRRECPGMRQSEAPPDGLWSQCVVGQRHEDADHWVVREVVAHPQNPQARPYCIDGCSTPPSAVRALYRSGWFIFEDKDNPTGAGPGGFGEGSSFYPACANHDRCYQSCDSRNRQTCDDQMLQDMRAACNAIPADHVTTFINNLGFEDDENTRDKCHSAANRMHTGLRVGGGAAFDKRRQQYCQCC